MILLEHATTRETILGLIDERIREAQDAEVEPRFILLGPTAYHHLRHAIADRYGREAGYFEQYQYLTIVVDPGREDRVVIVPAPRVLADGARLEIR